MERVKSKNAELAYRVIGTGRLPVLLIGGWGLSSVTWSGVLEHLEPKGLKLLVPDLRGSGESSHPASGYGLSDFAEDMLAVADGASAREFVAVGHSMGGQVAMWLAANATARVRGLVLVNPPPPTGLPLPPEVDGLFRGSAGSRESHQQILQAGTKDLKPEVLARLLDSAVRIPQVAIQQSLDAWSKASFESSVRTIRAPTLVIGSDDPFMPQQFLAEKVGALIPDSRMACIRGAGHHVPSERPYELAQMIQAFLAGLRIA